MNTPRSLPLLALATSLALATGCASTPRVDDTGLPRAHDARSGRMVSYADMIDDLAEVPMVYVGESHTNLDHHDIQLHVINDLANRHPNLIIGMEMFQRPFQEVLDRWTAGEMDEATFLRESDWFNTWGTDWSQYRPILLLARYRGIRVIALNAERAIIRRIGQVGLEDLEPWMRSRIPADIDTDVATHRQAIRDIFFGHPGMQMSEERFERFYSAQCTWDETMAESAVEALSAAPAGTAMVVLAGSMHVRDFHAIPERARRRNGLPYRVVLPMEVDRLEQEPITIGPGRPADFVIATGNTPPMRTGRLGVALRGGDNLVKLVVEGSAAFDAGLRAGDRLLEVNGVPVIDVVDLKLGLDGCDTGDTIALAWERDGTRGEGSGVMKAPAPMRMPAPAPRSDEDDEGDEGGSDHPKE